MSNLITLFDVTTWSYINTDDDDDADRLHYAEVDGGSLLMYM